MQYRQVVSSCTGIAFAVDLDDWLAAIFKKRYGVLLRFTPPNTGLLLLLHATLASIAAFAHVAGSYTTALHVAGLYNVQGLL